MTEIISEGIDVSCYIDAVVSDWERQPEAWNPGDPLHVPDDIVRPMFQIIEPWAAPPRCEPCQVSWTGVSACWVCGVMPARVDGRGYSATVWFVDEIANYQAPSLADLQAATVRPGGFLSAMLVHPRRSGLSSFMASVVADAAQFVETLEAVRFTLDQFVATDVGVRRVDRHHPRPLPIDGRAYHQRQRNRRRR